ncbi:hypothetical protein, partial [Klebsiella quasipneumoniae]|uniref:hypothetical protein n=1 Tax=Klebsiella quasipneumoniae TaxID=1463165 RepID=UPI001CCBCE17
YIYFAHQNNSFFFCLSFMAICWRNKAEWRERVPTILRKERNEHLQGGADEPFRDSYGAIDDDGKYIR